MITNRREFLRRSLCTALGGVGLYSALGNLNLVAAAARASKGGVFPDYKAAGSRRPTSIACSGPM
jgi:hypothetical protein